MHECALVSLKSLKRPRSKINGIVGGQPARPPEHNLQRSHSGINQMHDSSPEDPCEYIEYVMS